MKKYMSFLLLCSFLVGSEMRGMEGGDGGGSENKKRGSGLVRTLRKLSYSKMPTLKERIKSCRDEKAFLTLLEEWSVMTVETQKKNLIRHFKIALQYLVDQGCIQTINFTDLLAEGTFEEFNDKVNAVIAARTASVATAVSAAAAAAGADTASDNSPGASGEYTDLSRVDSSTGGTDGSNAASSTLSSEVAAAASSAPAPATAPRASSPTTNDLEYEAPTSEPEGGLSVGVPLTAAAPSNSSPASQSTAAAASAGGAKPSPSASAPATAATPTPTSATKSPLAAPDLVWYNNRYVRYAALATIVSGALYTGINCYRYYQAEKEVKEEEDYEDAASAA